MSRDLVLDVLPEPYSIARLDAGADIPSWALRAPWFSMTRTGSELSVVCESRLVPAHIRQSGPWRILQVEGPLDFDLTGILSRLTTPLAEAEISIFAVSTYDTDYVLVRAGALQGAIAGLQKDGVVVRGGGLKASWDS